MMGGIRWRTIITCRRYFFLAEKRKITIIFLKIFYATLPSLNIVRISSYEQSKLSVNEYDIKTELAV